MFGTNTDNYTNMEPLPCCVYMYIFTDFNDFLYLLKWNSGFRHASS